MSITDLWNQLFSNAPFCHKPFLSQSEVNFIQATDARLMIRELSLCKLCYNFILPGALFYMYDRSCTVFNQELENEYFYIELLLSPFDTGTFITVNFKDSQTVIFTS